MTKITETISAIFWQWGRPLAFLLLCLSALFCLTACGGGDSEEGGNGCKHEWEPATCVDPITCKKCGKTQGEPLGHTFAGNNCTGLDTCVRCGAVIQAQGHMWVEATCTEPKTCSKCGATEGEPLGHEYLNGVCIRCGDQTWTPLEGKGSGSAAVDDIMVSYEYYTLHSTHSGGGDFSIRMKDATGADALLVQKSGAYDGTVLIYGASPIHLDITASGDWTYKIDKITPSEDASGASGVGDGVTPFAPFKSGTYHITHDGSGAFYVYAFSVGSVTPVIQPVTGPYTGDVNVTLPESGNTLFEVHASGNWSIVPAG